MNPSKAVTEMREAAMYALAHGWVRVPAAPGIFRLRRSVTHATPEGLPERYWDAPTYDSHEFISVVMNGQRISAVFHQVHTCPWVGGNKRKISAKSAHGILFGV